LNHKFITSIIEPKPEGEWQIQIFLLTSFFNIHHLLQQPINAYSYENWNLVASLVAVDSRYPGVDGKTWVWQRRITSLETWIDNRGASSK
jgi:hypothetical protein